MSDDIKWARGVRGRRPNRGCWARYSIKRGGVGRVGAESFAYNASKVCNKIAMEKSKIPHISANFHQILNANEVGCHSYLDTK